MRRPRVKSPLSDISRQGIAGHGNSITLSDIISGEPLEISNLGLQKIFIKNRSKLRRIMYIKIVSNFKCCTTNNEKQDTSSIF